jgi:glycerol-3-phosphate dehydrogenase
VSSLLTNVLKDSGRRHSKIFIAWTKETEQTAEIICERLNKEGLSAWMRIHIEAGRRFRDEVRHSIQNADIVIAVLPK